MTAGDAVISRQIRGIVSLALEEDIGGGDKTSRALVAPRRGATAAIVSRGPCVVCGTELARMIFRAVDRSLKVRILVKDGQLARKNSVLLLVSGKARSILAAERTVLNFMQRLIGTATMTRGFVRRVERFGTVVLDTRKTAPGMRALEKYAVLCGGGRNHRMGLYDMVLIKDNHRRLWGGRLDLAVLAARKANPGMLVEVEVENERELKTVLKASPDWILLDNMAPARMRRCVRLCSGKAKVEASGGITLANAGRVAATGVNAISLGCLTHSAPAADLSLEM